MSQERGENSSLPEDNSKENPPTTEIGFEIGKQVGRIGETNKETTRRLKKAKEDLIAGGASKGVAPNPDLNETIAPGETFDGPIPEPETTPTNDNTPEQKLEALNPIEVLHKLGLENKDVIKDLIPREEVRVLLNYGGGEDAANKAVKKLKKLHEKLSKKRHGKEDDDKFAKLQMLRDVVMASQDIGEQNRIMTELLGVEAKPVESDKNVVTENPPQTPKASIVENQPVLTEPPVKQEVVEPVVVSPTLETSERKMGGVLNLGEIENIVNFLKSDAVGFADLGNVSGKSIRAKLKNIVFDKDGIKRNLPLGSPEADKLQKAKDILNQIDFREEGMTNKELDAEFDKILRDAKENGIIENTENKASKKSGKLETVQPKPQGPGTYVNIPEISADEVAKMDKQLAEARKKIAEADERRKGVVPKDPSETVDAKPEQVVVSVPLVPESPVVVEPAPVLKSEQPAVVVAEGVEKTVGVSPETVTDFSAGETFPEIEPDMLPKKEDWDAMSMEDKIRRYEEKTKLTERGLKNKVNRGVKERLGELEMNEEKFKRREVPKIIREIKKEQQLRAEKICRSSGEGKKLYDLDQEDLTKKGEVGTQFAFYLTKKIEESGFDSAEFYGMICRGVRVDLSVERVAFWGTVKNLIKGVESVQHTYEIPVDGGQSIILSEDDLEKFAFDQGKKLESEISKKSEEKFAEKLIAGRAKLAKIREKYKEGLINEFIEREKKREQSQLDGAGVVNSAREMIFEFFKKENITRNERKELVKKIEIELGKITNVKLRNKLNSGLRDLLEQEIEKYAEKKKQETLRFGRNELNDRLEGEKAGISFDDQEVYDALIKAGYDLENTKVKDRLDMEKGLLHEVIIRRKKGYAGNGKGFKGTKDDFTRLIVGYKDKIRAQKQQQKEIKAGKQEEVKKQTVESNNVGQASNPEAQGPVPSEFTATSNPDAEIKKPAEEGLQWEALYEGLLEKERSGAITKDELGVLLDYDFGEILEDNPAINGREAFDVKKEFKKLVKAKKKAKSEEEKKQVDLLRKEIVEKSLKQQEGLADLQGIIERKIANNLDISSEDLNDFAEEWIEKFRTEYLLTAEQISEVKKYVNRYYVQHEKVVAARAKHKKEDGGYDDISLINELVEADLFDESDRDRFKVSIGPTSIDIEVSSKEDMEKIFRGVKNPTNVEDMDYYGFAGESEKGKIRFTVFGGKNTGVKDRAQAHERFHANMREIFTEILEDKYTKAERLKLLVNHKELKSQNESAVVQEELIVNYLRSKMDVALRRVKDEMLAMSFNVRLENLEGEVKRYLFSGADEDYDFAKSARNFNYLKGDKIYEDQVKKILEVEYNKTVGQAAKSFVVLIKIRGREKAINLLRFKDLSTWPKAVKRIQERLGAQEEKSSMGETMGPELRETLVIENRENEVGSDIIIQQESIANEGHPDTNEDAVFSDIKNKAAGVFDGMGGHAAGDVASKLARDYISEKLKALPKRLPSQAMEEALKNIIVDANKLVLKNGETNSKQRGMGTTASIVKIWEGGSERKAIIGNVGDSRVYRYSDGKLEQITLDDSELRMISDDEEYLRGMQSKLSNVVDFDTLSDEEARIYRRRNRIQQYLGAENVEPRMCVVDLMPGDKIIVMSDGVGDNLTDNEMAEILKESGAGKQNGAKNLVNAALQRSRTEHLRAKEDDMSAIVMEFGGNTKNKDAGLIAKTMGDKGEENIAQKDENGELMQEAQRLQKEALEEKKYEQEVLDLNNDINSAKDFDDLVRTISKEREFAEISEEFGKKEDVLSYIERLKNHHIEMMVQAVSVQKYMEGVFSTAAFFYKDKKKNVLTPCILLKDKLIEITKKEVKEFFEKIEPWGGAPEAEESKMFKFNVPDFDIPDEPEEAASPEVAIDKFFENELREELEKKRLEDDIKIREQKIAELNEDLKRGIKGLLFNRNGLPQKEYDRKTMEVLEEGYRLAKQREKLEMLDRKTPELEGGAELGSLRKLVEKLTELKKMVFLGDAQKAKEYRMVLGVPEGADFGQIEKAYGDLLDMIMDAGIDEIPNDEYENVKNELKNVKDFLYGETAEAFGRETSLKDKGINLEIKRVKVVDILNLLKLPVDSSPGDILSGIDDYYAGYVFDDELVISPIHDAVVGLHNDLDKMKNSQEKLDFIAENFGLEKSLSKPEGVDVNLGKEFQGAKNFKEAYSFLLKDKIHQNDAGKVKYEILGIKRALQRALDIRYAGLVQDFVDALRVSDIDNRQIEAKFSNLERDLELRLEQKLMNAHTSKKDFDWEHLGKVLKEEFPNDEELR